MEFTVSQQQGRVPVTVFHVKGDIDGSTYAPLQAQMDQAIQAGAHNMVIDLTEVNYMSSAGLRMINHAFNLLRGDLPQESDQAIKQGIRDGTFKSPHLKLVNPGPHVMEVLKTAGIDMFIESRQSVTDAVASF